MKDEIEYPKETEVELPEDYEDEEVDVEGGISSCCGATVRKGFCSDCKEGVC